MISIFKLEQLPPVQRARKLYKLFVEADKRCGSNTFPSDKASYIRDLMLCARLLGRDEYYAFYERQAFLEAAQELERAWNEGGHSLPNRQINTIRHILGRVVGKIAADWDFDEKILTTNDKASDSKKGYRIFHGMHVYLEDTRSPYNVGAMFRTAECYGVERMYLSPLCAPPDHPRATRSAMGCVDLIPWEIARLDQLDLPIFVLETGGVDIANFKFPQKGIMITGSEELGASNEALSRADSSLGRVSIPLYGRKASLNVSVAFGIAMEHWVRFLLATKHDSV